MQLCWLRAARALLLWEFPAAARQVLSVGCPFHPQQQDLVSVSQPPPEMGLQLKGTAWICCGRSKTLLSCGVIPALHSLSSRGCGSPLSLRMAPRPPLSESAPLGFHKSFMVSHSSPGEGIWDLRAQCHLLLTLCVILLCLKPALVVSFSPSVLQSRSCSSPWDCSQLPLVFRAVELTSKPLCTLCPQPKEISWNSS